MLFTACSPYRDSLLSGLPRIREYLENVICPRTVVMVRLHFWWVFSFMPLVGYSLFFYGLMNFHQPRWWKQDSR